MIYLEDIEIDGLESLNGCICNINIVENDDGTYRIHIIIDNVLNLPDGLQKLSYE